MTTDARRLLVPLALIATAILFFLVNPWIGPDTGPFANADPGLQDTLRTVATVSFWILAIAVVVLMFVDSRDPEAPDVEVASPRFARYLFGNTRAGLFWLPIRLFVGFSWLESGWGKFTAEGNAWLGGGAPLRAYWERAAAIPEEGRPPITFEWYRDFINFLLNGNHEGWFAYVIVFGELLIGLGLLLGALTGIAAFFGAFMNMSFLLAGSASTNPIMFTFAIGLILGWKVAGYYGVDRWLLPLLGVPWHAKLEVSPPAAPEGAPSS